MTGSMYAAIAGLQTHMQKMNVIGNNIANANTYGFKPGVTSFTESMYTSLKSSTEGGQTLGGMNASQIGYGAKVSSIDLNMAIGNYSPTGINSHLYMNGNGFFMVGAKPDVTVTAERPNPDNGYATNANSLTLTRVGKFNLDGDGYLVDASGNCVYGFMPQGQQDGTLSTDANDQVNWDTCLRPIRLPLAAPVAADPTAQTIAANAAVYPILNVEEGNLIQYPDTVNGVAMTDLNYGARVPVDAVNLSVGQNGVITAVTDAGDAIVVGCIAVGNVVNPYGLTKESDGYYRAGNNAGDLSIGTCGKVITGYMNNVDPATVGEGVQAEEIGAAGTTTILSGGLESSKTDIAQEFADLITTQRGFQANTKIITVTDEMLSDLVAMKR